MASEQPVRTASVTAGRDGPDPAGNFGDVLDRAGGTCVALDANWRYAYVNRFEQPISRSPIAHSFFFQAITDRERIERQASDNAALLRGQNRVLEEIAHGAPLEHTLDVLLRFIEAECPEMICSILLPATDRERVRHGAAPSLPPAFTSALEGDAAASCPTVFAMAAFRPDAVIVEDITRDPLWEDCRAIALEHGIRAAWSSPILDARGGVLGTFVVYARAPGRPSARHRYLIDVATHTAATALVNHQQAEARRASEERLRLAVTGGNVGIWEWDVVHDRFELSDQLRAMFAWNIQADPITLQDVISSVHRDDRPQVTEALERSVNLGVDFDVEYRVVGPGGAVRWIATKGAGEYRERSTPVRMMGVALDVTTRKETEIQLRQSEERLEQTVATRTAQLRSRNEELKAFAYTVSHDLKAPLRGIAGYARELDRRHSAGLDVRGRYCLDQILAATRNLDRLIEDLLQYARLDAETPTRLAVDLAPLVLGMIRDRRPVIVEQGSEVTVDLAVTRVVAWERGLNQVISNLFDNALKYSRQASPPRVRLASESFPGGVRVIVSDNGIGFDPKYHDRIFGLFNRLVRHEDFEGTGAGLAIARKLVDKMGGTIRAESTPGAGATFIVELPHVAPAAAPPAEGP